MLMSSVYVHNSSAPLFHDGNVKHKRPAVRAVLAANLRALKDRRDWTQTEVANKAHISQRYVSSVLNQEQAPTTEIVDALASAFGLPGWLMLVPDLPVELLDSQDLPLIIKHYLGAGPDGRALLDKLAEREFHHSPERQKVVPISKTKSG